MLAYQCHTQIYAHTQCQSNSMPLSLGKIITPTRTKCALLSFSLSLHLCRQHYIAQQTYTNKATNSLSPPFFIPSNWSILNEILSDSILYSIINSDWNESLPTYNTHCTMCAHRMYAWESFVCFATKLLIWLCVGIGLVTDKSTTNIYER